MGEIWDSILGVFRGALELLHGVLEGPFGAEAWGWSIIALTVVVRVLLLPLAIKQTRSMRAMQAIQPKLKALQKKHKVDRDLMRKDPETYKARKAKLNEEMMALYKEEGVNPASSCLPLLLQAPIFLALFRVLNDFQPLKNAPFYFFTSSMNGDATGLGGSVSDAGLAGWSLIVLMAGTMFWSQRQLMARNAGQADAAQAQQQKIMMYVMPVFLAVISFNFPLGVLLYWVTTNLWQMGQQAVILREVRHDVEASVDRVTPDRKQKREPSGGGPTSSTRRRSSSGKGGPGDNGQTPTKAKKNPKKNPSTTRRSRDHLPRRSR